jgi:hypothetical protein
LSYADPTIEGLEEIPDTSIYAGFDFVSCSAWVDEWIDPTIVIEKIAHGRRDWMAHLEKYLLARTVHDIIRAKKEVMLGVKIQFSRVKCLWPKSRLHRDLIDAYSGICLKKSSELPRS